MTGESYYRPDSLCDTSWVQENLSNQNVVILEVDYDPETAYNEGHLPNAHLVWWKKDINDARRRDILSRQQFEDLMSRVGTTSDSELILYGDFNNWFAAFAFWVFDYYGHKKLRIMNGGRKKWEAEKKEYTKSLPNPKNSRYHATPPNEGIRAYFSDVKRALESTETTLVDVRSPK
jgi:thiosulfate/3-mercaptopyruvate sulfurtransferase